MSSSPDAVVRRATGVAIARDAIASDAAGDLFLDQLDQALRQLVVRKKALADAEDDVLQNISVALGALRDCRRITARNR